MTPIQIAIDIERGIVIKAQIAELTKELKQIEERLEIAGRNGDQVPLQNPNLEGKQFIARSAKPSIPVRFESDLIAASFAPDSIMHQEVVKIAGIHFARFFKPSNKFERIQKEGEAFRQLARELLAPDDFAALIRAVTQRNKDGIAKSKIVVGWDDAKELPAAAAVA